MKIKGDAAMSYVYNEENMCNNSEILGFLLQLL